MANQTGGSGGPSNPLSSLLIPTQFHGLSELLGMLGNLLLTAERAQDPEIKLRYVHLFDLTVSGLSSYIDSEFYSDPKKIEKFGVVPFLNPKVDLSEALESADLPPVDE